jgi:hypothetical protein
MQLDRREHPLLPALPGVNIIFLAVMSTMVYDFQYESICPGMRKSVNSGRAVPVWHVVPLQRLVPNISAYGHLYLEKTEQEHLPST